MPETILYIAMSLDGYIATPDGGIDWLSGFELPGEDYGYSAFYASVDSVLVGRRTFEQTLGFPGWPFEGKQCWVWSHRPLSVERPDVHVTARAPGQVLAEMGEAGIQRSWLVGGGALIASFRAERLISEYIVSVIPIVLGAGIPLFAAPGTREELELTDSRSYSSGLVQLRYRPAPASS